MTPLLKSTLLATQSDARLLSLARAGVEPAFEALADRYRRPLLRHCRQLCLSQDQAEEILRCTFDEARAALRAGSAQLDALPANVLPWLQGIAQGAATEAMRNEAGGRQASHAHRDIAACAKGAAMPNPDEVLALRGAFAMLSSTPLRRVVLVRADQGREDSERPFEIADGALRGLMRRTGGRLRDGITALTPPQLLAWALGRTAQGLPSGGTQGAELTAGGGAGLAGLAIKGGVAALTAGLAITGSAIVQGDRNGAARSDGRDRGLVGPAVGMAADRQAGREVAFGGAPAHGSRPRDLHGYAVGRTVDGGAPRLIPNGGGGAVPSSTGARSHPSAGSSYSGTAQSASSSSRSSFLSSSGQVGATAGPRVTAAASATPGAAPSVSAQASVGGGTAGQAGVQASLGGSQPSQESGGGSTSSGSSGGSGSASRGAEASVGVALGPLGSAGVKASLP